MKIVCLLTLTLLSLNFCLVQNIFRTETFWIPESIDWKPLRGSEEANFSTIFIKNDSLVYVVNSYQRKAVDSMAFGVEPDFSVKKGRFTLNDKNALIELKLLYGNYMEPNNNEFIRIVAENGVKYISYHDVKYIETKAYTQSSRNIIKSYIEIAEDTPRNIKIVPVEE